MKDSGKSIEEVSQLSAREIAQIRKRYALHRKYEEALNLYANTNSTVRDIAKQKTLRIYHIICRTEELARHTKNTRMP